MELFKVDGKGKCDPLSNVCDRPEHKLHKPQRTISLHKFFSYCTLVWTPTPHRASLSGQFYLTLQWSFMFRKSHVRLVAARKILIPLPHEEWERILGKCNVFESVEEEDPQNDCKEPTDCSYYAINRHIQPFFEKNGGAGHDRSGKEDIIDGSNNGCVKDVERFVQVVNLNTDADYQADDQ